MSNIPDSAVSAAFTPVQRTTSEALRARKVQSLKDSHHAEEVDELDDTAVNSVRDQQQRGGGRQSGRDQQEEAAQGEHVEIQALKEAPLTFTPVTPIPGRKGPPAPPRPQLDISA